MVLAKNICRNPENICWCVQAAAGECLLTGCTLGRPVARQRRLMMSFQYTGTARCLYLAPLSGTDVNIALCLQFNTCSIAACYCPLSRQTKAGVRMPKLTPGSWLPVLEHHTQAAHLLPAHADTMPDPSTRWGDSATILTVMSGITRCFRSFKWSYPSILNEK